ncbi:MAG: hypothetical protein GYB31_03385 [Bacteroidetes bacterium]|nr:hypothetical protein [Bacteroidota bacterium]
MGKHILYFFVISFFCLSANFYSAQAQPNLALGEWNSYLPYRSAKHITQSESKLYFATDWSILVREKDDGYKERFSKVDGLSYTGISLIKYHPGENILIVVYTDSSIDLIRENDIISLFDIPNFQGPIGDKVVRDVFIDEEGGVFLAANYGVSKLDVSVPEFEYTTFTGVNTNGIRVFQGHIYATTDIGVYRISEDNAFPEDIAQWEFLGMDYGFPGDYFAGPATVYNDKLYVAVEDSLYSFSNEQAAYIHHEEDLLLTYLTSEGARLIAGFYCEGCKGNTLYFGPDESFVPAPVNCMDRPLYALEDDSGNVWYGDQFQQFRVHEAGTESCNRFTENSPYSHRTQEIHITGDQVWVASGGVRTNYNVLRQPDGLFWYINGVWGEYNTYNTPEFSQMEDGGVQPITDLYTVTSHPESNLIYAGSFYDGLFRIDREAGTIEHFLENNSSLNNPPGDPNRTRVSGLAWDSNNNLWVSNHSAERPVSVLTADEEWISFAPNCGANALIQVAVDEFDNKWFAISADNAGLLIFNEGDISDPGDDQCRVLTVSNSNLPTNRVNCVELDLDGDIWVGTEQGVVVFECGNNVFDPSCQGSLRIVEQDNFGAYLLETENVRTIAVDGANRKWFGTDNGIFVQSPNGEEQVAFFDESNSPLFDNIISDIAINPETGEVIIGTNKGLISLRGQATEGPAVNTINVKVWPNPVRPDYEGPIAISGLAQDANVKITDIHGTLVYETTALGGQAIWDGRDYTGRRASSGVYLVFSTSTQSLENPDAVVAKIVLVN